MESEFSENKRDRDEKHGEMVAKVDNLTDSVRKLEQIIQGGRQQPTPAKLEFDAPAATGDKHLGKDVVVKVDDATTTTTEQSSNSTFESIAANESLPDATKEEAVDLKDTVGANATNSLLTNATPKKDVKIKSTTNLSLLADTNNEANNFKDMKVKVEKQLETAPRTPGPRDFTLRGTGPTSTAKKDQRPPMSNNKRRLAATPHSRTRPSEAVSAHVVRRKKGRMQESANSEAKRVNVKHEQIFQTKRQTRSASKKGSR